MPRAERLDSRAWRAARLVCADVDAVLRPSMSALQDLYHACASYRPPGGAGGEGWGWGAVRGHACRSTWCDVDASSSPGCPPPPLAVARGPLRLSIDDWFGLLGGSRGGSGGGGAGGPGCLLDEASCGAREAALAFVWASDATASEEGSGGELAITLSGAAELAQALAHVAEVSLSGTEGWQASQSLVLQRHPALAAPPLRSSSAAAC